MTSINSPAIKTYANVALSQLVYGNTLIVLSENAVIAYNYAAGAAQPIYQYKFVLQQQNTKFLAISRRDASSFMVLVQQSLKTYYRVYDLSGIQLHEYAAPRSPYYAYAIEGTPLVAVHYMYQQRCCFAFETVFNYVKPVRIARAGTNNFFYSTCFFNAIRISAKNEAAASNPVTQDHEMQRLLVESDTNDKKCYVLFAVHYGEQLTVYREYIFKFTKQYRSNDLQNLNYYTEMYCEVLKELYVPVVCHKYIPIYCNSEPKQLLFNSFALFTNNEIYVYKYTKANPTPVARARSFYYNGAVCFVGGIIAAFSTSLQLVGADGQWNDEKFVEKFKQYICKIFAPYFAENLQTDEESAKQYILSYYLPPVPQHQFFDRLTVLAELELPAIAISGSSDGKNLILGLDDGSLVVFSIYGLRNAQLMKYYTDKCGEVLGDVFYQLSAVQVELAQAYLSYLMNEFYAYYINAFTGQTQSFTPNRLERARSAQRNQPTEFVGRSRSTETPRKPEKIDPELSILRNSQLMNVLDEEQLPHETIKIDSTAKLIEMGYKVASSQYKSPKKQEEYADQQAAALANSHISELQEQLETVYDELASTQKEIIYQKESILYLFEQGASTLPDFYPEIKALTTPLMQNTLLSYFLDKYKAFYISSTQKDQRYVPSFPTLIEQTLLYYGQTSDLFAIRCRQNVLLSCGHYFSIDGCKLALELNGPDEYAQIQEALEDFMYTALLQHLESIEKCPVCKQYVTQDYVVYVQRSVRFPQFLMFSNSESAQNLLVLRSYYTYQYRLEGLIDRDSYCYVQDYFGRFMVDGREAEYLPEESIRVYALKDVDYTRFSIAAELIGKLMELQSIRAPSAQENEELELVQKQLNYLRYQSEAHIAEMTEELQEKDRAIEQLKQPSTEAQTLKRLVEQLQNEKAAALKELEGLRFDYYNSIERDRADEIVRRCLRILNAHDIPTYSEYLYQQLEIQCIYLQNDLSMVRNSYVNYSRTSQMSASTYSQLNPGPRRHGTVVIVGCVFGLAIVVLMVLIYLETNALYE